MPKFNFTEEQCEQFKDTSMFTDENGNMRGGKFIGQPLRELPSDYLEYTIYRLVSHAIAAQQELNSRSAEMLESLVTDYPELEETLVAHWEANYQVTR